MLERALDLESHYRFPSCVAFAKAMNDVVSGPEFSAADTSAECASPTASCGLAPATPDPMLAPFFSLAMRAPTRQAAFRRAAVRHLVFVGAATAVAFAASDRRRDAGVGLRLPRGRDRGGGALGWRMTQLPKSQALEFSLTSPVQPRRVFLGEALVGLGRLALVQIAGVPALFPLVIRGVLNPTDLLLLVSMPLVWGAVAGLGLTVWAYETRLVRRLGEMVALLGILVYLTVGVLAGEHLKAWLDTLPGAVSEPLFDAFKALHTYNPFAVMAFWFDPVFGVPVVARDRAVLVGGVGVALAGLMFLRGMGRLRGHFHDRHYRPITDTRAAQTERIGERPLSWWAVRRVMEYSGRVNIWLAGGFGVVYAAYLLAGDHWPTWMGRMVFDIFERMGGSPALVTGLAVLAAVPAAFQYGLWDSTVQDRCRRLELLLLTGLDGGDYWHASLSAAWRRGADSDGGRSAVGGAGDLRPGDAGPGGGVGRRGGHALVVLVCCRVRGVQQRDSGERARVTPDARAADDGGRPDADRGAGAGRVDPAGGRLLGRSTEPPSLGWLVGPLLIGIATVWLARRVAGRCEGHLRLWYDRNQGTQPAAA